jgi:hypothetical protein
MEFVVNNVALEQISVQVLPVVIQLMLLTRRRALERL